jgi:hypothetical protein
MANHIQFRESTEYSQQRQLLSAVYRYFIASWISYLSYIGLIVYLSEKYRQRLASFY